jgi:hypothetical protein
MEAGKVKERRSFVCISPVGGSNAHIKKIEQDKLDDKRARRTWTRAFPTRSPPLEPPFTARRLGCVTPDEIRDSGVGEGGDKS